MIFSKKILLIDYAPQAIALVKKALGETGRYEFKEERDSGVAMKAARWFQPDLILVDANPASPRADAVARQLQMDPAFSQTPVVFLKMNAAPSANVISAGVLGGYSFFAQPIRMEDVVRYVAELFKRPVNSGPSI